MVRRIYINRKSTSKKNAIIGSEATPDLPIRLRDFVFGDVETVQVFICDGDGAFDAISGDASYSLKVAVGTPGSMPTSGTFTLTFGANTTSALSYAITPAALQTALEGLASIGSGNVKVTGGVGYYLVEFIGSLALANQALISSSSASNLLSPQSSVTIAEIQAGSGSQNEKQSIRLVTVPVAINATWTTITSPAAGWEGTLELNTFRALEELAGAEDVDLVFEAQITDGSGNRETLSSVPVKLRNEVIDESSLVPITITTVTSDGMTVDQLKEIFVQFVGNPNGATIALKDSTGTYTATLGVSTGGAFEANIT